MLRTLLGAVLWLALAACAAPQPAGWQKAGATDASIAADTAQCRATGQQQAARLYPLGSSNPTLGGAGMVAAQQEASTDRKMAEIQFVSECMEGRGYTRQRSAD